MKRQIQPFVIAFALALPLASLAAGDHESHHQDESSASVSTATLGEVKKVDKEAGKVTLKHGPIENLDMPAMTMLFRVKQPEMLDQLREGDKIKFTADRVNGALTITSLEPAN